MEDYLLKHLPLKLKKKMFTFSLSAYSHISRHQQVILLSYWEQENRVNVTCNGGLYFHESLVCNHCDYKHFTLTTSQLELPFPTSNAIQQYPAKLLFSPVRVNGLAESIPLTGSLGYMVCMFP